MKNKRILMTGAHGFLGSHMVQHFRAEGYANLICPRQAEYDLTQVDRVRALLKDESPEIIIHAAATVGGIGANRENPGLFFYNNLVMGVHLMEEARLIGVEKFIALGTVCSYPKFTPVPFKEDDLWNGYPEETNAPYGLAKKMMLIQAQTYREQYNFNAVFLLPVNLYGPRDNFDLNSSHVIPALIRKFLEAKAAGRDSVTLWGDGSASREFLYVGDCARAIRLAMEKYNSSEPVNIGTCSEITIKDLAALIQKATAFKGNIEWDTSKPNGQPRRCLDTRRAKEEFGFESEVSFEKGLKDTIAWYLEEVSVQS